MSSAWLAMHIAVVIFLVLALARSIADSEAFWPFLWLVLLAWNGYYAIEALR